MSAASASKPVADGTAISSDRWPLRLKMIFALDRFHVGLSRVGHGSQGQANALLPAGNDDPMERRGGRAARFAAMGIDCVCPFERPSTYDPVDLAPLPLLVQTGYLTIQGASQAERSRVFRLG